MHSQPYLVGTVSQEDQKPCFCKLSTTLDLHGQFVVNIQSPQETPKDSRTNPKVFEVLGPCNLQTPTTNKMQTPNNPFQQPQHTQTNTAGTPACSGRPGRPACHAGRRHAPAAASRPGGRAQGTAPGRAAAAARWPAAGPFVVCAVESKTRFFLGTKRYKNLCCIVKLVRQWISYSSLFD